MGKRKDVQVLHDEWSLFREGFQSAREAYIAFLNSNIKGEIHVHSGGRLKGSKL